MTTCRYINSGQSNLKFEYLGEFETEFDNILGHESGAQVGSIHGKTRGQKSRATVPLMPPVRVMYLVALVSGKEVCSSVL
jgi:hypothetical protein